MPKRTTEKTPPMKTLIRPCVIAFTFSAGLAASAFASPVTPDSKALVNDYGEPAGFGNTPQIPVVESKAQETSASLPGSGGLYVMPGSFAPKSFESIGAWQARAAAESRGTVTIGPLEVLESGPTGPMTPEAQQVARDEVTAQVLTRIQATDHIMHSLKTQARAESEEDQARFKAAADEVAQRREALRENLRVLRATSGDQWSNARSNVAVSFNAYVESTHRAQAAVNS